MDSKKKIIKISDYYKDHDLPEECFSTQSIKNLLELSAMNNIDIFDKDKKKFKNKKKIIKDCENLKKIKLKEYTSELNKNKKDFKIIKIKEANDNFFDKLESIDSIVNIINDYDDDIKKLNNLIDSNDEFIEIFSN